MQYTDENKDLLMWLSDTRELTMRDMIERYLSYKEAQSLPNSSDATFVTPEGSNFFVYLQGINGGVSCMWLRDDAESRFNELNSTLHYLVYHKFLFARTDPTLEELSQVKTIGSRLDLNNEKFPNLCRLLNAHNASLVSQGQSGPLLKTRFTVSPELAEFIENGYRNDKEIARDLTLQTIRLSRNSFLLSLVTLVSTATALVINLTCPGERTVSIRAWQDSAVIHVKVVPSQSNASGLPSTKFDLDSIIHKQIDVHDSGASSNGELTPVSRDDVHK